MLGNCSKSKLVTEFIPYAKKAARNAAFKWDIEADDTFQVIMLDAWRKIDNAMNADEPIAMLMAGIRFSVGHELTARYWRRGRGETDQISDDFDAVDTTPIDLELKIDFDRAIEKLPKRDAVVIKAVQYGYSMRALADIAGVASSTMVTRLEAARNRLSEAMAGNDVKVRNEGFSLVNDEGLLVSGGLSSVMKRTGLSRGSISNLRTGKTPSVKGWMLA